MFSGNRWTGKRLLLGMAATIVFVAAAACSSAPAQESAAPQLPPAAAPAPSAPQAAPQQPQAPQQPAPAAPAATAVAPSASTAAPVARPEPPMPGPSQPQTSEVAESTGITFWSDLAAQCSNTGGHLRMAHSELEYSNLNPATVNQVVQFSITAEVLSGLVQLNPDLEPVPDLAESWSISEDLLTYTFKLRENAKFHDGRPVTADDWVFTYDHTLDPKTQSIHTKGLEGVNRPVKIDDYTLEISTDIPRASFLSKVVERASGRVMTLADKEYIAEHGEGGFNRMPHGAGPFRVTDHTFGERLELEAARDTYYDPSVPCLDRVTMFNIGEPNTIVAALQTGEVDMIYDFAPQFWTPLEEDPSIVVDTTPDVGFQYLRFNVRPDREEKTGLVGPQPWDDLNVIHAVAKALDREEFIRRAFQGRAIPAYGPIPPGQKFYFEDLSQDSPQAFNLEEAKQLMANSTAPDGFEVEVLATPENKVVIEALGGVLQENINVTLIADLQDNSIAQPREANGEFQSQITGSGGDPDPDDAIDDWFAAGSKFNHMGYDDPVVNEMNLQQKTTIDPNARKEIILKLNRRIGETCPCVFVYHNIQRTAYDNDVKGYVWIHALRQLSAVWLDR